MAFLYAYRCPSCGHQQDDVRSVEERHNGPNCAKCGTKTEKLILPPQSMPDIQPYRSVIDGSLISSRSKHREHLKAHGCIEVGNEKLPPPKKPKAPPGAKEAVIAAVKKHTGML
jgi:putative FmdB family regulatory protein